MGFEGRRVEGGGLRRIYGDLILKVGVCVRKEDKCWTNSGSLSM